MSIVDDIVQLEWEAFGKVQNEGGRASCQDDFDTFHIMRASQFLSWDSATLMSYLNDLQCAAQLGRNLVQEKYARMMVSTAPEQYASFAQQLPPLSMWQQRSIERIIETQLAWREAFARDWPKLADQARLIRTSEDTPHATSFETYLRGELGTYSADTLRAYLQMMDACLDEGRNLTTVSMEHTAKMYGYTGLAAAEAKLG